MNEQEIERLFYKYGERVYGTAFRILKDKESAKDIVQEVFVALYSGKAAGKISNIEGYLAKCGVRKSIDFLRREKRSTLFKDEYKDESLSSPGEYISSEEITAKEQDREKLALKIKEIIMELPQSERIILSLHLIEEYNYREIKEITGLNENTIRSKFLRGKRKVIEQLREGGYES